MKKLLIITYYWPPAGGSGVLRWLKFSKYLREFGWEPVIYTAEGAEYAEHDPTLERDIPQGITVIRRKIWEPYSWYKRVVGSSKDTKIKVGFLSEAEKPRRAERFSRWIRGNLFIPDARRFWIPPSVRFLTDWLRDHPVDAIASTGPPHSTHIIARGLAKRTKLPWLADFRDPWTDIDFYKDLHLTPWADRKHHRMELSVLKSANEVVAVGKYMAERFATKHPREYRIITNGFDEEDLIKSSATYSSESFVITHAGSIGPDRNTPGLWQALGELVDELEGFREKLKIRLLGNVDHSVWRSLQKEKLDTNTERVAHVPHSEILKEMASASLLLLAINNVPNSKGIITGKIFEYMLANRPILCIGPEDGDAAYILASTKRGITIEDTKIDIIKSNITEAYSQFLSGSLYSDTSSTIDQYSRKSLTNQLVQVLDSMLI